MSSKINVAVIGCGAIGRIHAERYKNNPDCELVALCDVNEQALNKLADELAVKKCYTDVETLLADAAITAVSVCVGNNQHERCSVAAFRHGKHVLLEKPMAMNAQQAKNIIDAAKSAGTIGQMGMTWRQHAEVAKAAEWVRAGRLGDIYHMRMVYLRRRGIPGLGGWFTTKALSGGGPVIDVGVHFFDALLHIADLWDVKAVSAVTHSRFGNPMANYHYVDMWAGPPKYDGVCDTEDYASGLVRFDSGASLSFELAWAANTKEQLVLEVLGDVGGVRLLADGERFTLYSELDGSVVDISPLVKPTEDNFAAEIAAFVGAIRGGANPAPLQQGYVLMQLIDALYSSAKEGREVVVNL